MTQSELLACPRCQSADIDLEVIAFSDSQFYWCADCGYMGPECEAEELARDGWNTIDRTDYKALARGLAAELAEALDTAITMIDQAWGGSEEFTLVLAALAKAEAAAGILEV